MLEAVKVNKSFEGKPVIRDFSFHFEKAKRYGIMGPSGCGKTTLLNLLMGLVKPDAGQIRGQHRLRFSAVFQENRLLEPLTAYANVRLVTQTDRSLIEELLVELGIPAESLEQPVASYSGGMKRRVALCRALLAEYDLLLMDEPYKGLDEETRARVLTVVDRMTRGRTVILVTHDAEECAGYERIELNGRNSYEEGSFM